MKKNIYLIALVLWLTNISISIGQNVGINTTGSLPDSSAVLDIASTDKGLLIPRMDSTARMAIINPAHGLMVFDSTYNSLYFHDGNSWNPIMGSSSGDNLGDHIATQDVHLKGHWLTYDGLDTLVRGIQISPTGNVGIKVFPQNDFVVGVGKASSPSLVIAHTGAGSLWPQLMGVRMWQAFTATDNMHITSFQLGNLFDGTPGWDYGLVRGEGPNGSLVASGSTSTTVMTFNDVFLKKDSVYTVYFDATAAFATHNYPSLTNYSGGASSIGFNRDFNFQISAKTQRTGLSVASSGVSFENYSFPNADGAAGDVLTTDGGGNVTWNSIPVQSFLADADNNTKIQVEKTPNDDIIRFDINGSERWNMQENTLAPTGNNLLIGKNAGAAFTSGTRNTAIGENALRYHTTSTDNVAIGARALSNPNGNSGGNVAIGADAGTTLSTGGGNVFIGLEAGLVTNTGSHNVLIGHHAGRQFSVSNSTFVGQSAGWQARDNVTAIGRAAGFRSGAGGVFLGYNAGSLETTANKLYIDNSSTSTPLIWGDFANDSLKVYGTFNINNAYSFPTTDGTSNGQVLTTDGAGSLSWTDQAMSADTQQISLIADTIRLTNGGAPLDLKPYAQQISLISDTIRLTNGGAPLDLKPYLTGDNLGNHTATQNIQLNGNWLSNDGDNEGIFINNTGEIGIGRAVGTTGSAKLELYGATASFTDGPHIQAVTSEDDYPVFQQLNWTHDNIGLCFDAYWNNGWFSSHAGSNFWIYKLQGRLTTFYQKGNSPGSSITLNNGSDIGTSLDTLGRFGIGRNAATNRLEVEGEASKTTAGSWLANSDARLKKNITALSSHDMLEKMLSLQGITYEWNDVQTGTKRPEGIQYGFTAQNIQEVFPSLVEEDNNGFLQTPYGTYDAMTVEAIRALNDKNQDLQDNNIALERRVEELEAQIANKNQQMENNTAELKELKNAFTKLEAMIGNAKTSFNSSENLSEK